jgi:hypothetical protein
MGGASVAPAFAARQGPGPHRLSSGQRGPKSADDLYTIPPVAFHPLKGDQKGRHALTLIDRWRMVVSFRDDALTIVRVEEVTKHYGD